MRFGFWVAVSILCVLLLLQFSSLVVDRTEPQVGIGFPIRVLTIDRSRYDPLPGQAYPACGWGECPTSWNIYGVFADLVVLGASVASVIAFGLNAAREGHL